MLDGQRFAALATLFAVLATSVAGHASSADLSQTISADDRLTLFARAVSRSKMTSVLQEPGPFTLFVPSDQALHNEGSAHLLDSVLLSDSNAERLADLVRHHIVLSRGQGTSLTDDADLQTLANVPLSVARVGSGLVVARHAVVTDRIVADNGIVYIVDRLLWPRDRRWESGASRALVR